jgi:hypothetical protein
MKVESILSFDPDRSEEERYYLLMSIPTTADEFTIRMFALQIKEGCPEIPSEEFEIERGTDYLKFYLNSEVVERLETTLALLKVAIIASATIILLILHLRDRWLGSVNKIMDAEIILN